MIVRASIEKRKVWVEPPAKRSTKDHFECSFRTIGGDMWGKVSPGFDTAWECMRHADKLFRELGMDVVWT